MEKIVAAVVSLASKHILITYILPFIAPAGAFIFGYAQSLPLMYIWVGAFASFGFFTWGLWNFDNWRTIRSVESKIVFGKILLANGTGSNGVCIGFDLLNRANFSIEFKVEKISTKIKTTVPSSNRYEKRNFIVPAGGFGYFYDFPIDLRDDERVDLVEGFLESSILYGRSGSLSHKINIKKKILIKFDDNKMIHSWSVNDIE